MVLDKGGHLSDTGSMIHIVPAMDVISGASGQGSQQCWLQGRVRGYTGSQQQDLLELCISKSFELG